MTEEEKRRNKELARLRRESIAGTISGIASDFGDWAGGLIGGEEPAPPDVFPETLAAKEEYMTGHGAWIKEQEALRAAEEDRIAQGELAQQQAEQEAAEKAAADRIWATYPEDIAGKKQDYLSKVQEIQSKARQLNMVAGLTGGVSQAGSFTSNAMEHLNTMMKYDEDERIAQISHAMNWRKDGSFDPPKSKQEAHKRALQLGASDTEAQVLSGTIPEKEGMVNWINLDTSEGNEWYGKTLSAPVGEGPTSSKATRKGVTSTEGWVRSGAGGMDSQTASQEMEADVMDLINAGNIAEAVRLQKARLIADAGGRQIDTDTLTDNVTRYIQLMAGDAVAPGNYPSLDAAAELELQRKHPEAQYAIVNGVIQEFSPKSELEAEVDPADMPELTDMWEAEWEAEDEKWKYSSKLGANLRFYDYAAHAIEGTPEWEEARKDLLMIQERRDAWIPPSLLEKYRISDTEASYMDRLRRKVGIGD